MTYLGFSKGGGKETVRSDSFEPNAASGEEQRGSGGVGPENFVLNYVLNQ